MKQTDVIIIGAGAAGLMAAYTMAKAGLTVTVLEARNRTGGRINTINGNNFSTYVELGAEFIHGNLPVTLNLLKEAGIDKCDVDFEMWQYQNGKFEQSDTFIEGFDKFIEKLNQLEHDMPLHDFLEENFSGDKYARMRMQIESYVAGYDAADVCYAGAFALRSEWNNEDMDAQHRIKGGYHAMIGYLENICRNAGHEIVLNTVASKVKWQKDKVEVLTTANTVYTAQKIIIALPLGVLQAPQGADGAIQFYPQIDNHTAALKCIGFGAVIKILLEFDAVFWESDSITQMAGKSLATMGFLFTEEAIPTFWTQAPAHSPLLTGWLGGPPAYKLQDMTAEAILQLALASLSNVFKISAEVLKSKLVAWNVANWTAEPYTRGSYAYDMVESPKARETLLQPVGHTIYFAGEYLYGGPAMGTVEAALTSGKSVAEMVLRNI